MATYSGWDLNPIIHVMGTGVQLPDPPPLSTVQQQALLAGYVFAAYVFAANPYATGRVPGGTWETVGGPPGIITFETRNPDPSATPPVVDDSPFALDLGGSEMHEKPGEWKFKYADHYVARALRIPYMYYKPLESDDTKGFLVRDYFLIGFEGGMGY